MIFGKGKSWEDSYDEDYANRANRRDRMSGSALWIHCLAFIVAVALFSGLAGLIGGQAWFEKTVAALLSPVGLLWLLLFFMSYLLLVYQRGWPALGCILGFLILSTFGNQFLSNQMMRELEQNYLNSSLDNLPKFDVVFLLGGGTTTNLHGAAQSDQSGDRVVVAAKLYHANKVGMIVCTGAQLFRTDASDMNPNAESAELLRDLNVPESNIAQIQGFTTAEEMQIAAKFLEQQNMQESNIGIITSAWHLNRAMRLANKNGIQATPIPSDFRSRFFTTGPNLIIPSSDSLSNSSRWLKEKLAGLAGR